MNEEEEDDMDWIDGVLGGVEWGWVGGEEKKEKYCRC